MDQPLAAPGAPAPTPVLGDPAGVVAARPASLWRDTLRNILAQRTAVLGLVLLVSLTLVAIFADVIAPYGPEQSMLDLGVEGVRRGYPPCVHVLGCPTDQPQHIMGLDSNLFDEFSRVVHGSRISLYVGFVTVGFAIVIGTLIGAVAGYAGGWVDNLLMRMVDVILSLPFLFLILLIVSFFGFRDIRVIIIALGIVGWTTAARLVRAEFLSIRETDYAQAARALGVGHRRLILRHLLPGALAPLVVACALGVADSVITESALSVLGFGIAPPEVSLGQMLGNFRDYFYDNPERIFYPGIALVIIVLCASFLGDGLRDALDPRQKVDG